MSHEQTRKHTPLLVLEAGTELAHSVAALAAAVAATTEAALTATAVATLTTARVTALAAAAVTAAGSATEVLVSHCSRSDGVDERWRALSRDLLRIIPIIRATG